MSQDVSFYPNRKLISQRSPGASIFSTFFAGVGVYIALLAIVVCLGAVSVGNVVWLDISTALGDVPSDSVTTGVSMATTFSHSAHG